MPAAVARAAAGGVRGRTLTVVAVAALLSTAVPAATSIVRSNSTAAPAPEGVSALSQVRLTFEPNRGQMDPGVDFSVRAGGATVLFTHGGITTVLPGEGGGGGTSTVRETFVSSSGVEPEGLRRALGIVSYFHGPAEEWITGVPTYRAIAYRDVWPGIDLVWRGLPSSLEYRFIVHPGADASRIRMLARGAALSTNGDGDLVLGTAAGDLTQGAPIAFQGETIVPSGFDVEGDTYGFRLGTYDPGRTLVIDPTIGYAGFIGGAGRDDAEGIAVDASGAAYVAGATASDETTFPAGVGPDLEHEGGTSDGFDAFVAKVAPSGASLEYAGYIGGADEDLAYGIAVDGDGAAYVVGETWSDETTFPVAVGPDLDHNGGRDGFIAKVSPTGASLEYAGYIGGAETDVIEGVAVDSGEAAYVAGSTRSDETTFPVIGGPDVAHNGPPPANDSMDAFVAKVSAPGDKLDYCGYIGGSNHDFGHAIALDATGAAYVGGATLSTETGDAVFPVPFPVTGGPELTHDGGPLGSAYDAFVAKVAADGTALEYAGFIGGTGSDSAIGVAVDDAGALYVAGATGSDQTSFPVTGGPQTFYSGGFADAFVAKVVPAGSGFTYAGYIGGADIDAAYAVTVDAGGGAHVAGSTSSDETVFPVGGGPDSTYNFGIQDGFVAGVAPSGASLDYAGYIGGADYDHAAGIAVDGDGAVYVAGRTFSTETTAPFAFPVSGGPDTSQNGLSDAFVLKLVPDLPSVSIADASVVEGGPFQVTALRLTVSLSAPSASVVSVDWATADGTATSPSDYGSGASTVTFQPGQTTRTVNVKVYGDNRPEDDETFFVNVVDASGGILADDQAVGTITNDDGEGSQPALSVADVSVIEGPRGTTTVAAFVVTLSSPQATNVSVDWSTADGTAVAPSDYGAVPATALVFQPGQSSRVARVKVYGDNVQEPSESFFVNLSNASGAAITDAQGVGTVTNDD